MGNKVLVIDDDRDICDLVRIALEGKGMTVRSAMTGEEGIKAADDFTPDVILLDHNLPDMFGTETAKRIRETSAGKNVFIVLMTGSTAPEHDISPGIFTGTLRKPFKLSDLAEYVKKIMDK